MKYENPKMEIIFFCGQDIITASTLVDTGQPGGETGTGDEEINFGGGFN